MMPGKIVTGTPTPASTGEDTSKAKPKANPKTPALASNLRASASVSPESAGTPAETPAAAEAGSSAGPDGDTSTAETTEAEGVLYWQERAHKAEDALAIARDQLQVAQSAADTNTLDVRKLLAADGENDVKGVAREGHNHGYESGYAAAAAELQNLVGPTGVFHVIPGGKVLLGYYADEDDAHAWVAAEHKRTQDSIKQDYVVEPLPRGPVVK